MCLCIPHSLWRNTVIIDKGCDVDEMMARPCVAPAAAPKTRRLWVFAPYFIHHNYIHFRNTKHLVDEEIPGPPMLNGIRGKRFRFGGSLASVLRNRYLQHGSAEDVTSAIVKEEQSDILSYVDEKKHG